MCGIVGIIGKEPVAENILEALRRLEYRGYDSAGIATLDDGRLDRRRAEGKLTNLSQRLETAPLAGEIGIGHTRWATHGAPSERNAHPHATDKVAVVHNGIIENYRELRAELGKAGVEFSTDTDTEVIAHLVSRELENGHPPEEAVRLVLAQLEGAFALAILFAGRDDVMIGARKGSPLAIGHGEGEMFLGSDAIALAPFTSQVTYLEDGDWVVITHSGAEVRDASGAEVSRPVQQSAASVFMVDRGNYRHFMAKEIHEQPEVIAHTLAHYADIGEGTVRMPELPVEMATLDRLTISACGTAYFAALIAKYWFESIARLPVEVDIASEFRYRESPLKGGGMALFISQSGETADTLAALRYCRECGEGIVSIVNVAESTIARESDVVLPTFAGPEIGVASTKAFTCQLTALAALVLHAARARGFIDAGEEERQISALGQVPRHILDVMKQEPQIEDLAKVLSKVMDVLFIGLGTAYALALECSLKMKDISYLHAEGYAAGELKHGPIALIDESVPVVVLAPPDGHYDKTLSNMQEVAARGGQIVLLAAQENITAEDSILAGFALPEAGALASPIIAAVPLQLIAYHTAVQMGTDVDQPRNLAKSVTVE
ncbi:MAG: glutamine--fructose-6-phosphate transaminase (isomerizing) [Rhizobiales bacterium]|nr:glutamine--fructose-6-phosphate transaminase (isomerizing) [Hyphomicrobiales bacterium]